MKILAIFLFILSFGAFAFAPINTWDVCEKDKCVTIASGDDLYLKHDFKTKEAIYKTNFTLNSIKSCITESDCWLYLGAVGDTAIVKLNNVVIGKYDKFINFDSLKFHIPTNLLSSNNQLIIEVKDLNETRFGLRTSDTGIGTYSEVERKSLVDWIIRTGSPLLSSFTSFVLLLGLIATFSVYRNSKILPLLGLSSISVLYLFSFSEIPKQFIDPIYASGPIHFTLRLLLDLSLVLVALSLYKPHKKIAFISKLPYLYIIPIAIMVLAGIIGIHQYAFYKTTMLIVAPLVIGGGFSLALLSSYYFEKKERQLVFPLFLGLFAFQVYDLIVFWELIPGAFTVKWYLPFLMITFSWIYVRRRIFEVRTLKIDAIVGDEVRKLAHDLAAPIKNLSSLVGTEENELIKRNINDLELLTEQVLGKYHQNKNDNNISQENLIAIVSSLKSKYADKVSISFNFSMEFDWYSVDVATFTRTFTNLITNSIKAKASKIKIHGYYQNKFLTIDFEDNGSGIPKILQPYIFDKGITSNKNQGNGIGLSFIKEKFDELGFHIDLVYSKPNCTTFKIRIPLNEIILIDDNPLVRDTWATLAKKVGLQFKTYASSKEIDFKYILRTTPIFIDHDLGEEDGLNVAQRLLKLGFSNVTLATGKTNKLHPQIQQIGKEFPCLQ